MLVLFCSTYICEQTFSLINFNKSDHRSRLTDAHLNSVLAIATTKLTPDFDTLAKKNVAERQQLNVTSKQDFSLFITGLLL